MFLSMNKNRNLLNIVLFWVLFSPFINSIPNTLYVGPDGNDSNPGTFDEPFSTISYAISIINPGDTIYIVSGTYILSSTIQISLSYGGTSGNLCHLFSYPRDTVILDFFTQEFGNRGINLRADYWFIKGLIIRNAGDNGLFIDGNYNRIEQCVFCGNDDTGLQISGGGSHNIVINCDSYNNADPDNADADGFAAKLDIGPGNEFHGCRSWNNSDDGWDLYEADDSVVIADCWTFHNGYLANESASVGEGNGFKLGGNHLPGNHLVKNCISFGNRRYGYHQNNNTGKIFIYNSLAWNNVGRNFNFYYETAGPNTLINNISFESGSDDRFTNCNMITNSWQGIEASVEDFLTLVPEMARDARLPDGSLPQNIFFRLSIGSNLIDAGTDVGSVYTGIAPDLGPFELLTATAVNTLTITTTGEGGVWLSPPGGTYEANQEVTLMAWNAENYFFDSWSGDASGTLDSIILIMDSDKSVTANFIPSIEIHPDSNRIEAENMILSGYIFERMTGASNGKVVRPTSTAFGSGQSIFSGEESYYRAIVRYLDYADGAATYQFSVNNDIVESWTGDVASGSSNEFISKVIINVYLVAGDVIKVESKPGGQEYGRIDCIDLVQSEYIEPDLLLTGKYRNPNTKVEVFPNPFFNILMIELDLYRADYITLELYSTDGRIITTLTDNRYLEGKYLFHFAAEDLLPGIYLLHLVTSEGVSITSMLKE